MKTLIHFTLALVLVFLSGCSSLTPTATDLATTDSLINEPLHEVDYDADKKGIQWISKSIVPQYYTALMVSKVELKRDYTQDKQIPEAVLNQLADEITEQLRQEISSSMKVVDKAGEHVAQINIRISRATTEPEDLKLTEIIPIGAVIGSVKMALGTRDKTVRIIVEAQILDSVTSKPLAERVSVISAPSVLENSRAHLNYEQIRENVDNFVKETRQFIQSAANEANQI
ncbi:DUF3313 domain-containing protein [Shewanella psychropiezotolerans]|uniref:DUF3313 domain-containing protein n=1 Tax=Shewanella psychropiezotolerans TaxID=2593655 RepID=A0ABX5X2D1_9GAMM|nr:MULTISPECIES: DUF3313 domain-containing protein [Shewanella]MPY21178.1 DUF3313 domain-containing protein [Shewanella sp. YLB-07]MPY21965.1 DUF3313 domain-containing protein [Shewanella sp. YLB-07]QDO85158.1 DUF3313 domain-containing protein [Shewanella psychropiezotolerans]